MPYGLGKRESWSAMKDEANIQRYKKGGPQIAESLAPVYSFKPTCLTVVGFHKSLYPHAKFILLLKLV